MSGRAALKPKVKPHHQYVLRAYMYKQADVLEALGIERGDVRRIICDGDNMVRVEVYTDK